ncbi:DUF6221 family protein [Microbispora bryophytorum]|uniref:DUF6221 family protein n=1 Tax=Microbispora bryophytorum TaxID=1460882 RepID=UPI0033D5B093
MDELITFLQARWDEEEDDLDRLMSKRLVQGYVRVHGERLLGDIASKRKVLAECVATIRQGVSAGLAETVLALLAEPYADRSDYPRFRA